MDLNFIKDYKKVSTEYKYHRNKAKRYLTKVKALEKKYYFLDRIVEPRKDKDSKEDDTKLEIAVLDLFKSLNFKCEKPPINAEVDVKVKFKHYYFGIEVKNGGFVPENDTMQAFKHKILNDELYHPITLYNNSKTNQKWDAPRIKLAVSNNYGLLMTDELLSAFSKLMTNKLSFEDFLFMLSQKGKIEFSKRAIDRAYKSEKPR